ncbi:MAG TPA: hypothetical protein VGS11_07980 [Candidatus Bathyarchaeia archaeon]|nr:hypothetical protein [Candidatus Bathyarchaeia archaeon]
MHFLLEASRIGSRNPPDPTGVVPLRFDLVETTIIGEASLTFSAGGTAGLINANHRSQNGHLPAFSLVNGIDAEYAIAGGKPIVKLRSEHGIRLRAAYTGTANLWFHWVSAGKSSIWAV